MNQNVKQIILLVSVAFMLRILFIPDGAVSFHYDMARDAYVAKQILEGDLKILGPPTSTAGLYHGVLYYYLIAIPYGLSNGDPRIAAIFLSFLNSLAIIPIMLLAKEFFKSKVWTFLAGLLFAIAFEAVQYGPWLSNPNPAMFTVALFFYGLFLWQKGKIFGLYLAITSAALSSQFQFFLIYLFLLLPVFKYLFKIKLLPKLIFTSLLIIFFGLSNFFIASIKFNSLGQILSGLFNISVNTQIDFRTKFSELFLNYINTITDLFTNNFLPVNVFLGGLLAFIVLYSVRGKKFILFCLLSNFPIFIFGGHTNAYATVGLITPAILGVIVLLQNIWGKNNKLVALAVILLIFVSNIYAIFKNSPKGQIVLVIPNAMILSNQLKLIDETYKVASGQPFSVNSITLPLWTNTTWAYLYSWYGMGKYGYVPKFYGRDQVGLLGEKSLEKIEEPYDTSFLILESQDGIPERFYNGEIETENAKTKLVQETAYGSLKLQLRTPKHEEED